MHFRDVKETFAKMPELFDAKATGNRQYLYQFCLTSGIWHLLIKDNKCTVLQGPHENPVVTLTTDDETWLNICNKEMSGIKAVLLRKMKVDGNIIIADQLLKLFRFEHA